MKSIASTVSLIAVASAAEDVFKLSTTFELQGVSVEAGADECVQNSVAEAVLVLTAGFEEALSLSLSLCLRGEG